MQNVPTNLSNLKSKVKELDVDKLLLVPVDLSKLSDVVKNVVVKKDVYNAKIKNIEDKTPDITNLATKTTLNAKINEVKGEIPSITNLATKTSLNTVENKIPSVSNLVNETDYNTKINWTENKITHHNHDIYITTPEFNKVTSENFAARIKQANFVTKTEFDNKLTSFNKRSTSNKTRHLEVEKKLTSLITKDYNFFFGRVHFTSNDGFWNMFAYQPTLNVSESKIDKCTEYIIGWKSKGLHNSKLIALHGAFSPNAKYFGNEIGIQFNNTSLVREKISYVKIVNVYIVYDLDNWSKKNPKKFYTKKLFIWSD